MYESFYKLSSKPFQLSPDPRFFYGSRGHKRALSYLRYGVKQGEGFIIITGDVGTGKSMLVGTLFQSLSSENVVAAQIVTTQIQADDMLRLVAASFGLAYQRVGKASLLRNLESYFRACVQEGKRVLLVVDEAQGLPKRSIEELRMLSNFQMGGRALLQSFLLGQREFRTTMRSEGFEQLRQRVIAAYHLRPLDEDETTGYIRHRLKLAGWANDPSIDDAVFSGIHQFSGGVPRRINTLCDRLLLFSYLEELHHIDSEAFASVAHDIIEEQGGPETDVEPMPKLVVPSPKAAKPEVVESAQLNPPAAQASSSAPSSDSKPTEGGDQRMASMEQSMVTLANAMREEMSLLRKALMQNAQGEPSAKDDNEE